MGGAHWHNHVPPLSKLSSLRTLDLSHCTGITDVSPLSVLSSLRTLDLSHCRGITDVSPLSTLSGLEVLDLSGCTGVRSGLESLCSLSFLRYLSFLGVSFDINLFSPVSYF
ncbi:putative leucine rich repeat protein (LRRP) [Trypanosoma vivax]|nr:putative leucine rich repeat protein (LRRP) [Trypanosoma vivax]